MFLYNSGRLQCGHISFEIPNNVLMCHGPSADSFELHNLDKSWKIILETLQNQEGEGIWGDWLDNDEVIIYDDPSHIIRAGFSGETAVWGGTKDLYYEVRFPLSKNDGRLDMLVLTFHIPHYNMADIQTIKGHPIMNQLLNSLRLEPSICS